MTTLTPEADLAVWDEGAHKWTPVPGSFGVYVGASSGILFDQHCRVYQLATHLEAGLGVLDQLVVLLVRLLWRRDLDELHLDTACVRDARVTCNARNACHCVTRALRVTYVTRATRV